MTARPPNLSGEELLHSTIPTETSLLDDPRYNGSVLTRRISNPLEQVWSPSWPTADSHIQDLPHDTSSFESIPGQETHGARAQAQSDTPQDREIVMFEQPAPPDQVDFASRLPA